jgi:hypothetical protein
MPRRGTVFSLLFFAAACAAGQPTIQTATALGGKWQIPLPVHGTADVYAMTVDVTGDTFSGAIINFPIIEGKVNGNEITFKLAANGKPVSIATARLYGDSMSIVLEDAPERPNRHIGRKNSWTAYRVPASGVLDWVPDETAELPFPTSLADRKNGSPLITGRYEAPVAWGDKTYTYEFVFAESGPSLTGKSALLGTSNVFDITDGQVDGDHFSFNWRRNGNVVAHFTGLRCGESGEQIALLMEDASGQRLPEVTGGAVHPMTGFRNDGVEPWYTWFPNPLEQGKMASYKALAEVIHECVDKGDIKTAAKLAAVLNHDWDSGQTALLKSVPDTWNQIDRAMDAFILPIIRYRGGLPDPGDVDQKYQLYLTKLKLAN